MIPHLHRLVGYHDVDPELPRDTTRWGRVTGGIYANSEQWLLIDPLHDHSAGGLVRAKRVHTVLPKAY